MRKHSISYLVDSFTPEQKQEWDELHTKIPLHEAWIVKNTNRADCYKAVCVYLSDNCR
eukprot:Pgem_evm1s7218